MPSIFFVNYVELKVFINQDLIQICIALIFVVLKNPPKVKKVIHFDGINFEDSIQKI